VAPVSIDYNGSVTSGGELNFLNANFAGAGVGGSLPDGTDPFGLPIYNTIFDISGSQYYSGDEGAPTFVTGTYDDQYDSVSSQAATVEISDVTAAPEPATWTLLLIGFGAAGGALRAHRRPAVA
jgi:hypothetical protein